MILVIQKPIDEPYQNLENKMIIIRMSGGLGNQMFQYALYLKFKSMGTEVYMEDYSQYSGNNSFRDIQLDAFGISYDRVSADKYYEYTDLYPGLKNKLRRKLFGRKSREYEEKICTFDKNVLTQNDSIIYGYYQSEKYFEDIKDKVINSFKFLPEISKKAEEILAKCVKFSEEDNLVSIHIRRGDYLDFEPIYGNICTDKYYEKAINYILDRIKNPVFIVITNDEKWAVEWVKKYVAQGLKMYVINGISEQEGYLDMCVMTKCEHNILANSSFSWWGAYLNLNPQKLVLVPSKWLNTHDNNDIYTKEMIKIYE